MSDANRKFRKSALFDCAWNPRALKSGKYPALRQPPNKQLNTRVRAQRLCGARPPSRAVSPRASSLCFMENEEENRQRQGGEDTNERGEHRCGGNAANRMVSRIIPTSARNAAFLRVMVEVWTLRCDLQALSSLVLRLPLHITRQRLPLSVRFPLQPPSQQV